jgi:endonuclease YncB( thermonuclease family)
MDTRLLFCLKGRSLWWGRVFLFIFLSFSRWEESLCKEVLVGEVLHVKDGDTLEVRHCQETLAVRIFGIDAPEKGQPFADQARTGLRALLNHPEVNLVVQYKDSYDRLVAEVILSGSRSVSYEMVRKGLAWHFTKYNSDPELARLEKEARNNRVGIWTLPAPQPPWEYRQQHRIGYSGTPHAAESVKAATRSETGKEEPSLLQRFLTLFRSSPSVQDNHQVVGNVRSRIYHPLNCPHLKDMHPENKVQFDSSESAQSAGYRPCAKE